jgi:alkanesulfonate monooxygenase
MPQPRALVAEQTMNLRFHWMLPKGGEVVLGGTQTPRAAALYRIQSTASDSLAPLPDMEGWVHFARQAEVAGIDSLLISFSRYEPDPFVVGCALGLATTRLKFIAAYRSGLMQPTTFVQQMNTLAALIQGRVSLNVVAGSSKAEQYGYGDFLPHDERYARAEEFLAVCHSFWRADGDVNFCGKYYQVEQGKLHTPFQAPDSSAPEVYVSGHSESAEQLARTQATCLLRVADVPEKLAPSVARLRQQGLEVCLRMCIISRPTREEAIAVAESLLPERDIPQEERSIAAKDDSQMYREAATVREQEASWLTPSLWKGLVPYYGPVWTTLLGTPAEIAAALLEYKRIGVTQFIMSGWPELDEVVAFGRDVLPLVRDAEVREDEPQ